jgi:hypothetical protein
MLGLVIAQDETATRKHHTPSYAAQLFQKLTVFCQPGIVAGDFG